jgi:antitoxin component YwqK of YwqJK toxin-antitoxin module
METKKIILSLLLSLFLIQYVPAQGAMVKKTGTNSDGTKYSYEYNPEGNFIIYDTDGHIAMKGKVVGPKGSKVSADQYINSIMSSGRGQGETWNFDGMLISYYKNGIIAESSKWANGLPDSVTTDYYKSGKVKSTTVYSNQSKNQVYTEWRENGFLARKEGYVGKALDGERIKCFKSGIVEMIEKYNAGIQIGDWLKCYDIEDTATSNPAALKPILKYKIGKAQERCHYVNGKLEGEFATYFENGKIESKKYYSKGVLNGDVVWYRKNGTILERETYSQGKLAGKTLKYDEKGNLIN